MIFDATTLKDFSYWKALTEIFQFSKAWRLHKTHTTHNTKCKLSKYMTWMMWKISDDAFFPLILCVFFLKHRRCEKLQWLPLNLLIRFALSVRAYNDCKCPTKWNGKSFGFFFRAMSVNWYTFWLLKSLNSLTSILKAWTLQLRHRQHL